MFKNKHLLILSLLALIFTFGFWLRYKNVEGYNVVFDYDQIEDQFYTYILAVDHKLPIIGRAIYGDSRLHHGVFYYYYNLPPFLLSSGNFLTSVYWNIFFNTATVVILFALSKLMFKKTLPAFITAVIVVSSFELIKFSSWLTIDTVVIFLVPLFFLGLWQFYQKRKWGLALTAISLGLAIQADLTFLYLIPILVIYWVIFRPDLNLRLALFSLLAFILTVSTLILTEIKLNFSGIKTLLNFSTVFGDASKLSFSQRLNLFFEGFTTNFANNLLPTRPDLGLYLTLVIALFILYLLFSKRIQKQEKRGIYFLLLYLFAPAVTLLVGYHDKPWFLIGLPPAIALITGYAISKLNKLYMIIPIVILIMVNGTQIILQRPNESYKLFDNIYDSTSYLKYQLQVVDYTYQESKGKSFAINAVTYPLYYNGLWAYLYHWYGEGKYKSLPKWLGGDQLHPYDLLAKSDGNEKIFYMIISDTPRIPDIYKNRGKIWAMEHGKLIKEKFFNGFIVLKMEINK